jgi:hypothetical protein
LIGSRSIAGLMLDESIVDHADAVTRQYCQNVTAALALRYCSLIGLLSQSHIFACVGKRLALSCGGMFPLRHFTLRGSADSPYWRERLVWQDAELVG